MLWHKKNLFINLRWHVGYGPLLSPFEVLEVPKTDNAPIVSPGLSKTPAPLKKHLSVGFSPAAATPATLRSTTPFRWSGGFIMMMVTVPLMMMMVMIMVFFVQVWH